ncbi:MAG: Dabb family protein [Lachnospiraceae bacterium]|nr:Dabb family protein [Lachnospiraceae bacterium]
MVKHVILWTLKEELSKSEKEEVKKGIKEGLEGLAGKIPGLLDIKVNIDGLSSSNADLMLDSTFENEEALKGYAVHPEHVAVADGKVRPYTAIRSCLDYEVPDEVE